MKHILVPSLLCMASLQAPAALIAGYQFDETTGTTAVDAIRGITGDATLNNGATFTTGQNLGFGNALTLDGTNDWASALNPVVNNQAQLTVSVWVNLASLTSWGTIVKDWASTATFHFGLDGNSANDNISNYIGGSGSGSVITSSTVGLNTWYHVAFTFDDATNTQNIYLNGTLSGTTNATTSTLAIGGGTMGIGASTVPHQFLNGKIDDLAFYDNVLTDSDIQTIYNNGLNGISAIPEPSCVALLGLGSLALLRRRR